MRPLLDERPLRPLRTWWILSVSIAVLCALCTTLRLWSGNGVGRLRLLGPAWILRNAVEPMGFSLLHRFSWMSEPYDLRRTDRLLDLSASSSMGRPADPNPHVPRDLSACWSHSREQTDPPLAFAGLHGRVASVESRRFKLVHFWDGTRADELYDLLKDPQELQNCVAEHTSEASSLRAELQAWRTLWGMKDKSIEAIDVTEEQEKRLRELGYVE